MNSSAWTTLYVDIFATTLSQLKGVSVSIHFRDMFKISILQTVVESYSASKRDLPHVNCANDFIKIPRGASNDPILTHLKHFHNLPDK